MEIAKTPYKSIYMTVPKTKFSKISKTIYEYGYFETQSCDNFRGFVYIHDIYIYTGVACQNRCLNARNRFSIKFYIDIDIRKFF